jgi:hypothetical protein
LKRTRRVEVIRYRRRSAISGEVTVGTDLTADQAAINLLLGIPEAIEAHIEPADDRKPDCDADLSRRTSPPVSKGSVCLDSTVTTAIPDGRAARRPWRFLQRLIRR